MNSVMLIGRLTADPQIMQAQNGGSVASFTLAVDRQKNPQTGEKKADFPRITCFGKLADAVAKNLNKGRMIAVTGRLQTGQYQNKNGETVYTTDVVAGRIEFLSTQNAQTSQGQQSQAPQQPVQQVQQPQPQMQAQQAASMPQAPQGMPQVPQQAQMPMQQPVQQTMQPAIPDGFEGIEEDVPF